MPLPSLSDHRQSSQSYIFCQKNLQTENDITKANKKESAALFFTLKSSLITPPMQQQRKKNRFIFFNFSTCPKATAINYGQHRNYCPPPEKKRQEMQENTVFLLFT
eukprot:TRINITY_DN9874_c1_g1_i1.p1 TRINITY_DN9874_c1_g1~~TRINITY_DN9874_c1_g1_i1.p1  ORF type:complete len:106 (-),score=3.93 TRINITY_DN9874_c1_g1_i1:148-465(-)